MKKIRVVQVGTWKYTHAEHHMMCMRSMPEHFDVVGIYEPNPEWKQEAMNKPVYKDLPWLELEDVLSDHSLDAILIEDHELRQAKTALLFAENGFNIHMDKPGGEDHAVFTKLVETVKKKHLVFQTGYMYRYNPALVRAQQMLRDGYLGNILSIEAQMNLRYSYEMLQWLKEFQGGMMLYLGCHLADLAYQFQGEPEEVIPYNMSSGIDGSNSKDFGFAILKYPRGVSFLKTTSSETGGFLRRQLIVSGTKGCVELKPIEEPCNYPGIAVANNVYMKATYSPNPYYTRTEESKYGPFGRYDDMMLDFYRMVIGEKENPHTPDEELAVHKLAMEVCGIK